MSNVPGFESEYVPRDDETEARLIPTEGNELIFDFDAVREAQLEQYGIGFPPVDGSGDFR
ncbi:MAG TPA: hypothetical protein VGD31_15670 [Sphingobacteriaceae bacterium]